jgi:hypothetical protein
MSALVVVLKLVLPWQMKSAVQNLHRPPETSCDRSLWALWFACHCHRISGIGGACSCENIHVRFKCADSKSSTAHQPDSHRTRWKDAEQLRSSPDPYRDVRHIALDTNWNEIHAKSTHIQ